jgi:hypothetical protein
MTKYKYFKSKNYRSNVNLVVESDIVEVSDQTSDGGTTPTLQEVTDEGAVTTADVQVNSISVFDAENDLHLKISANGDVINFHDFAGNIKFSLTVSGFLKTFLFDDVISEQSYGFPNESGIVNVMTAKTSSFTAQKNVFYLSVDTLTVTDPTPTNNQGYIVFVRNGTATIGGVGYTSGNLIYRFYQGGAWSSTVFGSGGGGATWGGITGTLADQTDLQSVLDAKANINKTEIIVKSESNGIFGTTTGNTAENVVTVLDIAANEFEAGDRLLFKIFSDKNGGSENVQYRVRAGTTGTTSDSLIATSQSYIGNNARFMSFERQRILFLTGDTIRLPAPSIAGANDISGLFGASTLVSLTPSSAWKLTITAQLSAGAETTNIVGYAISKIKSI